MSAHFYIASSDGEDDSDDTGDVFSEYMRRCKARQMRNKDEEIHKSSYHYQEQAWSMLHVDLFSLVMDLRPHNVKLIKQQLYNLNIERGKGLLCRFLIYAQRSRLKNSFHYARLIALINIDFPSIVELLITRCIVQFKVTFSFDEDKSFIFGPLHLLLHLINFNCVHTVVGVQLLKLALTYYPCDFTIELVWRIVKICGRKLYLKEKEHMNDISGTLSYLTFCPRFRRELRYKAKTILMKLRKHIRGGVNRKYDEEIKRKQLTHKIHLFSAYNPESDLDYFTFDLDYFENEKIFESCVPREDEYDSDSDSQWETEEEEVTEFDFESSTPELTDEKKLTDVDIKVEHSIDDEQIEYL